ncbi:winged helix-turn-helix domain-containing protein [Pelodictyon luteolum]|uniref:Transcriptional regulator n=1 Tax=Chlorobium luteolum (strain DSM 273 / BCRC 81028 / 2530) TaxID=319225 RepID=Q3B4B7_CHLL3|nr:transcriptional regulator [Pelodictyon luteolum]ABB23814.1 transcriptional regulator [Pelodictyon luteolum DSM 273]
MKETAPEEQAVADFNHQRLDKHIHARIRFAALSYLLAVGKASFVEIRDCINATDGNLSVHMRKLESAGYISCDKGFQLRKPHTIYSITGEGREAFLKYRRDIRSFLGPELSLKSA